MDALDSSPTRHFLPSVLQTNLETQSTVKFKICFAQWDKNQINSKYFISLTANTETKVKIYMGNTWRDFFFFSPFNFLLARSRIFRGLHGERDLSILIRGQFEHLRKYICESVNRSEWKNYLIPLKLNDHHRMRCLEMGNCISLSKSNPNYTQIWLWLCSRLRGRVQLRLKSYSCAFLVHILSCFVVFGCYSLSSPARLEIKYVNFIISISVELESIFLCYTCYNSFHECGSFHTSIVKRFRGFDGAHFNFMSSNFILLLP